MVERMGPRAGVGREPATFNSTRVSTRVPVEPTVHSHLSGRRRYADQRPENAEGKLTPTETPGS